MKSPKRSTRGLLPGYRTEASPALHREDVPFDVVGPLVAFHGTDLVENTWKGSILVLVRREPRGQAQRVKEAEKKETLNRAAEVLESTNLTGLKTEESEQDVELQPVNQHDSQAESDANRARSNSLQSSDSSLTVSDEPPSEPPRQVRNLGLTAPPFRRTSSHEVESFQPSPPRTLPTTRPGQGVQPTTILKEELSPVVGETASTTGTQESSIAEKPKIEYTLTITGQEESQPQEITDPTILYAEIFEYTAFRFDIIIPQQASSTTKVKYRVILPNPERFITPHDELGVFDFLVPGVQERWHCAFFSCSGFEHTNREADQGVGTPGLWHDILRIHKGHRSADKPDEDQGDCEPPHSFHLLIGGGDQIYQDDVFDDVLSLHDWMYNIPYQRDREAHPWTEEMETSTDCFYFRNACLHFGTTVVGDAMARIPHLFVPDDHDLFDGFGSYPDHLQNCPVFQGIGKIATKEFLLFQHHTTPELAARDTGMVPASPNGPMGRPHGFNFVYNLSNTMSIVGLDNRTERQLDQVFYPQTLDALFARIEATIPITCQHLLVMQPVPMIFGDIGALERPLESFSKMVRKSKFWTELIAKCGFYKSEQLKYGEPQLLDDCVDHWTSHHHQLERQLLFAKFGQLARTRFLRVSWLTGDVHCAGFARMRTIGTTAETELYDPMTMYQVISSAIGNAPPPVLVRFLFEWTDGPPWGVFRKPAPHVAKAAPRVEHHAAKQNFFQKMRSKYAAQFVGRPIKQDPGHGQVILGRVEEGLVRIGELELVAGARGGQIHERDRETRRHMKRKLLRRRNWCEISQVDPNPDSFEVGTRTVLEFALHVERLRELKHMLGLKGRGHHADLAEMDKDNNVPATNVWRARVVGLEPTT